MKNKTEWFPPHIKPVRIGVYEVRDCYGFQKGYLFSYWHGHYWGYLCRSASDAFEAREHYSHSQSKIWRGFTKEQS